jgi:hypothetical protein
MFESLESRSHLSASTIGAGTTHAEFPSAALTSISVQFSSPEYSVQVSPQRTGIGGVRPVPAMAFADRIAISGIGD